jgi:hypothetical protein
MDEVLRLRVPAELKAQLQAEADRRGVKLSEIVREKLLAPEAYPELDARVVKNGEIIDTQKFFAQPKRLFAYTTVDNRIEVKIVAGKLPPETDVEKELRELHAKEVAEIQRRAKEIVAAGRPGSRRRKKD